MHIIAYIKLLTAEAHGTSSMSLCHMEKAKAISTPLDTHFKLSCKQSPSNEEEKKNMNRVPYAFAMAI